MLLHEEGGDAAEGFEAGADLRLFPVVGQVLDKDVVEDFAEVGFLLGFVLDADEIVIALHRLRQGASGRFGVLEADEAVAAGGVVLIDGDFGADDVAVGFKHLFEAFRVDFFGDLAHEQILRVEAGRVRAEQFGVVGEGTAWLALEGEEAELLCNFVELVGVLNLNDCSVEGLAGFTTHLGLVLQVVAGLVLDDLGELGGRAGLGGQVVQVNEVGLGEFLHLLLRLHLFLFFVCKE